MSDPPASLPAGWLPTKLREALAQLPGAVSLLPSLPVLEVGVMGTHVLVTFCLGPPPPTLLGPPGGFGPAVTLHVIWPYGYWYWQPETGTDTYLGGVPRPEMLPAAYQQVLSQRSQQPPFAAAESPDLDRYLRLLEEVLLHDWLQPHADIAPLEQQVAGELQQVWVELGEESYQEYYQRRGGTLLAWLTQATYQPCWVAEAVADLATAAPLDTLPVDAVQGTLFPAWLDGRQCVVIPFYKPAPARAAAGSPTVELLAACYVAYPTREVYWHRFSKERAQVVLATHPPAGQAGPPALQPAAAEAPAGQQALARYYELVTSLLKAEWLVTRFPVLPAEATLAGALVAAFAAARTPELTAYYLSEAWQLTSWLARATKTS